MPGHQQIIELLEQIIAEQSEQKLVPLVEQLRKAVTKETNRLNAEIAESELQYTELNRRG